MAPSPTSGSLREFDAGAQSRKKLALVAAITTIVLAAAGICYLAAGQAPGGTASEALPPPASQHDQRGQATSDIVGHEDLTQPAATVAPSHLTDVHSQSRPQPDGPAGVRDHGRKSSTAPPEEAEEPDSNDHIGLNESAGSDEESDKTNSDRNKTLDGGNKTPDGGNETPDGGNETLDSSNETLDNHSHRHHHENCSSEHEAACVCIASCRVFGADPKSCNEKDHRERQAMVAGLIQESMHDHYDMCNGMRCIKKCAEELGCLDKKVLSDCRLVQKSYERQRQPSDPPCELDCEG